MRSSEELRAMLERDRAREAERAAEHTAAVAAYRAAPSDAAWKAEREALSKLETVRARIENTEVRLELALQREASRAEREREELAEREALLKDGAP